VIKAQEKLEKLAKSGNGNYKIIQNASEAIETIMKEVKINSL
jgi:hypothetical protein